MAPTQHRRRNACIATALVLLGIGLVGIPLATASDSTPDQTHDGNDQGSCFWIDPWGPGVAVNPMDCITR